MIGFSDWFAKHWVGMCPPAPLFSDSPTVSFLLPSFASSYEGCITQGYRITTASSLYAHKEPFLHCPGLRGFLAGPYESLEFRGASINVVGIFCPPRSGWNRVNWSAKIWGALAPPNPWLRQTCFKHGNGTMADTYLETKNTFENLATLSSVGFELKFSEPS